MDLVHTVLAVKMSTLGSSIASLATGQSGTSQQPQMPNGSGPVTYYTRAINDEKLKPIDKIYDEATGRPATRSVDLTNRKREI